MEFPADVVWSGFSIFIKLAHCQWGFKPDSHWGKLLILGNHTDIKGIWCDIAMTSPMTQKSYTITFLLLWQHVSIATVVWVFFTLIPKPGTHFGVNQSIKTPPKTSISRLPWQHIGFHGNRSREVLSVPIPDLPAKFDAHRSVNGRGDSSQTESVTLLVL